MLLLVFHLEYRCIVQCFIRLMKCLKMGWSLCLKVAIVTNYYKLLFSLLVFGHKIWKTKMYKIFNLVILTSNKLYCLTFKLTPDIKGLKAPLNNNILQKLLSSIHKGIGTYWSGLKRRKNDIIKSQKPNEIGLPLLTL